MADDKNFASRRAHHHHLAYTWIPVFGAFIWFAMLWAMLITWLASGRPKYPSQDGKVTYISDVGATFLKPLFIVGCVVTGLALVASLSVERWLRHAGRLPPHMRRRERVLGGLAIASSVLAALGLLLLSVLDTVHHPSLHRLFLLLFMVGVALSAIFTILEFRWVSKDFGELRKLRRAYIAKGLIAGILIVLAIAFGITLYFAPDVGGILEWLISFGFTFYLLTFFYDLRLSKHVAHGELGAARLREDAADANGSIRHGERDGSRESGSVDMSHVERTVERVLDQ